AGAVANHYYTQERMAEFVGEFAGMLGLHRFAIGGNSMGWRASVLFTITHPERVTHLILVDSGGLPTKQVEPTPLAYRLMSIPIANRLLLHITPRSLIVDGLNSAIVHKDIITDDMIDRYWDFIRMDGTREATITRGRIRHNRIRDDILDIETPSLILWCDDDLPIPV